MPEEEKSEEKKEEKAENIEKKEKDLKTLIFHTKPVSVLTLLTQEKKWYISELARESKQTYVYATKIVKLLEKNNIVTITREKKKKIVKLTEKGEKIAKMIEEIMKLI
jgi:predicted transcriptional regulator